VIENVRRAVWADASKVAPTEVLTVIDDAIAVRIVDLAMRVAELMLSAGASAKEVTLAALRIGRAYGLKSMHVNVTYNSIMVADHRGLGQPVALMRVVFSATPDYARLQRLQQFIVDVERGLPLPEAEKRFRVIRRTPFLYRSGVVAVFQALLAVGVGITFGASWLNLAVVFLVALGVAGTQLGLGRLRVPLFFSQVGAALVLVTSVVGLELLVVAGIEPFTSVQPLVVMSSGIMLMLAGLTVVGAAQDAIDGFSLTAGGRILELTLLTLGLALGLVVGLQLSVSFGIGLDMPSRPLPLGAFPAQVAGSALMAVVVALTNGAGLRIVLVSGLLGLIAWVGYALPAGAGLDGVAASFLGASVACGIGAGMASALRVPSVAVTTAGIIPLVPGTAVFRGLLGFVQAGDDTTQLILASQTLVSAAMTGLALAAGATLGLFVGAAVRSRLSGVRTLVRTPFHARTGAGTSALTFVEAAEAIEATEAAEAAEAAKANEAVRVRRAAGAKPLRRER